MIHIPFLAHEICLRNDASQNTFVNQPVPIRLTGVGYTVG